MDAGRQIDVVITKGVRIDVPMSAATESTDRARPAHEIATPGSRPGEEDVGHGIGGDQRLDLAFDAVVILLDQLDRHAGMGRHIGRGQGFEIGPQAFGAELGQDPQAALGGTGGGAV